jgi:hypothetical protein
MLCCFVSGMNMSYLPMILSLSLALHCSIQSSLHQKEALLAEALASHASQLEMWRAEVSMREGLRLW